MENAASVYPWLGDFFGRGEELEKIQECWASARQGKPHVCMLEADSGYGKTKIVQAFYSFLTSRLDSQGYWPKSLLATGSSLDVMPQLDKVATAKTIPWVWWGVRWADPAAHNAVIHDSRLINSTHEPSMRWLTSHLQEEIEAKHAALGLAPHLAKALLKVTGYDAALTTLEAILDLLDVLQIRTEYREELESASAIKRTEIRAAAEFLATMAGIVEKSGPRTSDRPLVLFLDDAHWMDPTSMRGLHDLWTTALRKKWPLLVIATHWEKEAAVASNDQRNKNLRFSPWFDMVRRMQPSATTKIKVGQLSDDHLKSMFDNSLPGLRVQVGHFVTQSGGNPRHACELILSLLAHPELFEHGNPANKLTPQGFEIAKRLPTRVEDLEVNRFNEASESVKDILGFASVQGDQFLNKFACELAERSGLIAGECRAIDLLESAQTPYVLAKSLDNRSMQFRSAAIRGRSATYITARVNPGVFRAALLDSAKKWVGCGDIASLSPPARVLVLQKCFSEALAGDQFEDAAFFADLAIGACEAVGGYAQLFELLRRFSTEMDVLKRRRFDAAAPGVDKVLGLWLDLSEEALEGGNFELSEQNADDCDHIAARADLILLELRAKRIFSQALHAQGNGKRALRALQDAHDLARRNEILNIEIGRIKLISGRVNLGLSLYSESREDFIDAIELLRKFDKNWGAFLSSAVAGLATSSLYAFRHQSGFLAEDLKYSSDYLKAINSARHLASHIPFSSNGGLAPAWVAASSEHDFGLAVFLQDLMCGVASGEKSFNADAASESVKYFSKALDFWESQEMRPDLRARTIWVGAVAEAAAGKPGRFSRRVGDARDWMVRNRKSGSSERRFVEMVAQDPSCPWLRGINNHLLEFSDLAWHHVDYDLSAPLGASTSTRSRNMF